jgi:TolB-like protein/class 3 adenylate cyclase/Tfp pilus assembly protein PilF
MVRQLTAIMFTDMAGYTALMQQDERQAKMSRDRQRSVLEDRIGAHSGRILQHFGDGTLSVFLSAIAAVRCAIEIQEALRAAPPVPLRIGIHTGDVVHDEEGVFGDGVNVASRIQAMSVAGGVLISGKVFDEVKNHPDIRTRGLGAFNLKHVQHPMHVFAVVNEGLVVPRESDLAMGRASTAKSVAVLPFLNMSADPENEFFSDGITEDLISALTRVNGLKVTARTSSFAFKNRAADVRQIAEQLGVTHILEGSVRRAGMRVRVTAQLICAHDGYHLFAENYDRSLEDVFAVQEEIASAIVAQLADHLSPVRTGSEPRPIASPHSHDTEAHVEYLKGRFEFGRYSPEGARRALLHFERSIQMAVGHSEDGRESGACALPYAGLAGAHVFLGAIGHAQPVDAFIAAETAARRALELEPDGGPSHVALAMVDMFYHWDFDAAYHSLQKALSLTPGSSDTHYVYSLYLSTMCEFDDALEEARTAVQLDPLSTTHNNWLAQCLLTAGHVAEALAQAQRTIAMDPHFRSATETLGWIHAFKGDYENAIVALEQLPAKAGLAYAAASDRGHVYAKLGRVDDALRMLALVEARQEAQPEVTLDIDYAIIHEGLGDRERAIEYLHHAVDRRMGSVIMMNSFVSLKDMRDDPRFHAVLDRIGVPHAALA